MSALELIKAAKNASKGIGLLTSSQKNEVLKSVSVLLSERSQELLAANQVDIDNGQAVDMSKSLQDRLRLTEARIESLRVAIAELINIPDPIGETVRDITRPNGLHLKEVRVPFGVIGAIYEARPNVTIDIACMALKTGSAIILRGGSAAQNTNAVLVQILKDALSANNRNPDAVQSVDEFGRDGANAMMKAIGLIDVLIPRGSA
ncbi:MAG: aldehyde dehydrogenase family protein, partial [Microbacteriaceae bacterium]|nr:aldehyde dehydrogenase family protein [Microbacteriaceae bacterium]